MAQPGIVVASISYTTSGDTILADLVDLARHTEKMSTRITKIATPEIERQRVDIAARYQQAVNNLAGIIVETPAIVFEGVSLAVDDEKAAERITELGAHFAGLKATALSEARDALDEGFDPENKQARDNLEAGIVPAIERLRTAGELPSITRLSALKVGAAEVADVVALLTQVEAEAVTLAQLATNADRARRAQLYAKVSAWMHDHAHVDNGTFPVCVG